MPSRLEFQRAVEDAIASQERHALSLKQKEQALLDAISPAISGERQTGLSGSAKNGGK